MSSHWEIEQGLSSSLLRCDGQIIYEGRWGDCHRSMLKRAEEDDVVTPGPAMKRIPAGQYESAQRPGENLRSARVDRRGSGRGSSLTF